MFWLYLFLIVWIPSSAALLISDIYRHWKEPWLEHRRTEGMISLSKTQQYLVMGFWPFAIVGLIIYFVGSVICMAFCMLMDELVAKWRS